MRFGPPMMQFLPVTAHGHSLGQNCLQGLKNENSKFGICLFTAGLSLHFPQCYPQKANRKPGMSVTSDELQQAGASPELARILADQFHRRDSGDLTCNPMAVALVVAFLGALGWLVANDFRQSADLTRLDEKIISLRSETLAGQARLGERIDGLEYEMRAMNSRLEAKLDQLLER